MVVFPEKVGFFSQTSASQSPNGTSRDLVFQEPLVSLPKAHPVFGGLQGLRLVPLCFHPNRLERGCQSPDWEGELRSVCSGTRTGYLTVSGHFLPGVGADSCGLPAERRFHLWARSPPSSLPRASSRHFWTSSVTCLRCFKAHRGLLFAVHCCLPSRV